MQIFSYDNKKNLGGSAHQKKTKNTYELRKQNYLKIPLIHEHIPVTNFFSWQ